MAPRRTMVTGRRAQRGFTLLELLVVIAVLMVLMGLSIAVMVNLLAKQRKEQTVQTLKALHGLCELYTRDTGITPTTMTDFLTRAQSFPDTNRQLRALPTITYSGGAIIAVRDGWGTPINFDPNTNITGGFFGKGPYFWSYGRYGPNGAPKDYVLSFE